MDGTDVCEVPLGVTNRPLYKGKDFPGWLPLPQGTPASQSLYSLGVVSIKEITFPLKKGPLEKDMVSVCI